HARRRDREREARGQRQNAQDVPAAGEESGHAFDIEEFLARTERQLVTKARPEAMTLIEVRAAAIQSLVMPVARIIRLDLARIVVDGFGEGIARQQDQAAGIPLLHLHETAVVMPVRVVSRSEDARIELRIRKAILNGDRVGGVEFSLILIIPLP